MDAPILRWKLNAPLEGANVSVYALNQRLVQAGRGVSRNTLYRLANEQPERIDLEVAGRVLWGLEQLTGKHYTVTDLLEYEPLDEQGAIVTAVIPERVPSGHEQEACGLRWSSDSTSCLAVFFC